MVSMNSGAVPQPGGVALSSTPEVEERLVQEAHEAQLAAATPATAPEEVLEEQAEEPEAEAETEEVEDEDEDAESEEDDADEEEGGEDEDADKAEDYSGEEWTFAALKAEIDRRNADREEDDHISKGGSADDLRARLVEDDAAQADASE